MLVGDEVMKHLFHIVDEMSLAQLERLLNKVIEARGIRARHVAESKNIIHCASRLESIDVEG